MSLFEHLEHDNPSPVSMFISSKDKNKKKKRSVICCNFAWFFKG